MHKLALGMVLVFAVVACNKASDKEIDGALKEFEEVYTGYFKTLEDNKSNPNKAIEEGQKYMDANKDKIASIRKVMKKRGDDKQIKRVEAAMQKFVDKSKEAGRSLGTAFGAAGAGMPELQKIQAQMQDMMKQMTDG